MKYILVIKDGYKMLFIEDDRELYSVRYDKIDKKWVKGGTYLNDARLGYDPSEPPESPYRFGNLSCMADLVKITKEEAEEFISSPIDEEEVSKLLK